MIRFEITAVTYKECAEKIKDYYNNYHPAGYGTWISGILQKDDGTFFAIGTRASSCD